MAISLSNIPFGTQASNRLSEYAATKVLVSDGQVDAAFVTPGDSFISSVTDARVESFLKSNTAPGPDWKAHELGGYDSADQSLFVENERVVLRSNVEEKGQKIRHLIDAPFEKSSGAVDLQSSTEGYEFVHSGKSAVFNIPL